MEVHCGFAGQDTGFDMSPKDQEYLNSCKVAVVTAAFGGGDILAQPIGMTKTSLVKVGSSCGSTRVETLAAPVKLVFCHSTTSRAKHDLPRCKIALHVFGSWSGPDYGASTCVIRVLVVQVCYVAFWDDITLNAQQAEGVSPDPVTGHVGVWRVVLVKNLPFLDQRRNGKIPKVSPWTT